MIFKPIYYEEIIDGVIDGIGIEIPKNGNESKKIFLICSTFGQFDNNENFNISDIFKKTIYKFYSYAPLQEFLYASSQDYFYKKFEEPEYLIYIYKNTDIYSLNQQKNGPNSQSFMPKYNFIDNKLILSKPHFYDRFACVGNFQNRYKFIFNNETDDFIRSFLLEAKNNIRKHWKNTKLVIVDFYPTTQNNTRDFLFENPEIKKYYEIIEIQDLFKEDIGIDNVESAKKILTKIKEVLENEDK